MCTYTYIKLPNGHHCITQNRDESRVRPVASAPNTHSLGEEKWLFPMDALFPGTWMTSNISLPRQYNLLNGAEERHKSQPPYRHSRALILMELMEFPSAKDYFSHKNLEGIEPFTVVANEESEMKKYIWDASTLSIQALPQQNIILSSSTLYTSDNRHSRESALQSAESSFHEWQDVINFHSRFDSEDEAICIDREHVYTQNIFSILLDEKHQYLEHKYIENPINSFT